MAATTVNGSSGVTLNGHSNGEQAAGPSRLQTDTSAARPAANESLSYENGLDAFQLSFPEFREPRIPALTLNLQIFSVAAFS